jgi:ATP-binding cassette subfamily F protein uup
MNYLSVENISKRYGIKELFSDVSFGIDKGQKVAIVAKNGAGKTSLLRTLCGIESPDDGRIVFRNEIRIGYLEQEDSFDKSKSFLQNALDENNPSHRALIAYNKALNSGSDSEMNASLEKMNELNAWDADVQVKEILQKLGFENHDDKPQYLSGGEAKRLALSKLLASKPDFMILDEPTNHLDLQMIEWLESYISSLNSTVLMVTHDRYFLEILCDQIFELDRKTLFQYDGNFSDYLEKKSMRDEQEQTEIKKAKNIYRTELEWMRRMPKARGTKSKSRQDSFYSLEKVAKKKVDEEKLEIKIKPERLGTKILEFHKVAHSIEAKKLVEGFTYMVKRNERIGIIGPNGSGKTTLLKLFLGQLTPDKGKIVVGETVKFGYYNQSGLSFSDDKRVIEVIRDIAEIIPAEKGKKFTAAEMLERFLFPRDMHFQHVRTLSGGEKKRLYLLSILMSNPNFLVLDEPTNDLDIYALAALENYLNDYQGCVVVVSHDRFFLDKLVDHLFVFQGEGMIKDYPGNYSQYLKDKDKFELSPKSAEKKEKLQEKTKEVPAKDQRKLSYNEQQEFKKLEREIQKLENRQQEMNMIISENKVEDPENFYSELSKLSDEIEEKSLRWMELAELA